MKKKVKCTKCGKDFDWDYETYVDVRQNPQFKENILSGKAFGYKCECGNLQIVHHSLLYVDPDNKTAIAMAPQEEIDISDECDRPVARIDEINKLDYTKRLVSNCNDLAEKIIINDSPYDDRVIEMVKVYYYDAIREQLIKEQTDLADMYFSYEDNTPSFWVRLQDGRSMSLEMDTQMYEDIYKDVSDKMKDATPDGFAVINPQWAYTVLTSGSEE